MLSQYFTEKGLIAIIEQYQYGDPLIIQVNIKSPNTIITFAPEFAYPSPRSNDITIGLHYGKIIHEDIVIEYDQETCHKYIDWGNGTCNDQNKHKYSTVGTYDIKVYGGEGQVSLQICNRHGVINQVKSYGSFMVNRVIFRNHLVKLPTD